MPKSPNQNNAQLNSTADTANGMDTLNNENALAMKLSNVASPVNAIQASSTMNAIDLKMFPTLPSSSVTTFHKLASIHGKMLVPITHKETDKTPRQKTLPSPPLAHPIPPSHYSIPHSSLPTDAHALRPPTLLGRFASPQESSMAVNLSSLLA